MAKSPVFDTSVFSPYKKQVEKEIAFALLPSIVLYELTATGIDESTLKKYDRWRVALNQNERLLTPTKIDWRETAKAIRRLYLKKTALCADILANAPIFKNLSKLLRHFAVARVRGRDFCRRLTTQI